MLKTSTPSFLYCALNFATMTFSAALEAAYKSGILDVEAVDEGQVRVAAGDGDNFLGLTLQDERHEEVEEVDVAGGVGFE